MSDSRACFNRGQGDFSSLPSAPGSRINAALFRSYPARRYIRPALPWSASFRPSRRFPRAALMPYVRVSLDESWQRFTPTVPSGARPLGIIQEGFQLGALLLLGDGSYAQVNGDVFRQLNRSRIEKALRKARSTGYRARPAPMAAAPLVTVRRRRRIVEPFGTDAGSRST